MKWLSGSATTAAAISFAVVWLSPPTAAAQRPQPGVRLTLGQLEAQMFHVKDAGFLYDSSLMASDDAYEILLDKQPTGVIELPIEWIVDDVPYLEY
jgi:hypothetical protein